MKRVRSDCSIHEYSENIFRLAERVVRKHRGALGGIYEISSAVSAGMLMSRRGWRETRAVLRAPRKLIEEQALVFVRDRLLGNEAVFNPLRNLRTSIPLTGDPAQLIDQARIDNGCQWCDPEGWHVRQRGLWEDEYGEVWSADGRVRGGPNWRRQAPISGIVLGDERMHNLLRLDKEEFVSLFTTAELYIRAARRRLPNAAYFMIFMNGGAKSAASVAHAHLQVVGRSDRHFAYAESIAERCPREYWDKVSEIHREAGLIVKNAECEAWANLAPVKERDITMIAPEIEKGAAFLHHVVQSLIRHGTNNFSIAAILPPATAKIASSRFRHWPPVLFRFTDRGDVRVPHGDIGCMELFGSSVVAADPFAVAGWLR